MVYFTLKGPLSRHYSLFMLKVQCDARDGSVADHLHSCNPEMLPWGTKWKKVPGDCTVIKEVKGNSQMIILMQDMNW